tara:strand:+ start:437 stop:619 length:183 start_codon:yes stop_codon:yes gene_type:complete
MRDGKRDNNSSVGNLVLIQRRDTRRADNHTGTVGGIVYGEEGVVVRVVLVLVRNVSRVNV